MAVPEWRKAVEEMEALRKNGRWKTIDLLKGEMAVGWKWVFIIKYNSDGFIEQDKARLVAKGFTQTYDIDYQETFALVEKLNSIQVLLSLVANIDWPLMQLDVKNAFLNGDLEEEVYMDAPSGFEEKLWSNKVCQLLKSLYGLKQSPRAWFERFTRFIKNHSFH